MRRALAEFVVEGIKTTIPIHREIFNHPSFVDGVVDTTFIERTWQHGSLQHLIGGTLFVDDPERGMVSSRGVDE